MIKVEKFSSPLNNQEKVTMRVRLETERERIMLEALFHNTYKLQELINKNLENVHHQTEARFTHEEVKQAADEFYVALVTNNLNGI
jgi:hypothetical protein